MKKQLNLFNFYFSGTIYMYLLREDNFSVFSYY